MTDFFFIIEIRKYCRYHLSDIARLRESFDNITPGCVRAIGSALMATKRVACVSLGVASGGSIAIEWTGMRRFTVTETAAETAVLLLADAVGDIDVVRITTTSSILSDVALVARLTAWEKSSDRHTLVSDVVPQPRDLAPTSHSETQSEDTGRSATSVSDVDAAPQRGRRLQCDDTVTASSQGRRINTTSTSSPSSLLGDKVTFTFTPSDVERVCAIASSALQGTDATTIKCVTVCTLFGQRSSLEVEHGCGRISSCCYFW